MQQSPSIQKEKKEPNGSPSYTEITLLGLQWFPKLILTSTIVYTILLILGIWLINVIGKGLFQFISQNVQIAFTIVVFVSVGGATVWLVKTFFRIPCCQSLTGYIVAIALAIVYWLAFSASSVALSQSTGVLSDESQIMGFAIVYFLIFPTFSGLLLGQVIGFNHKHSVKVVTASDPILRKDVRNMDIELTQKALQFLFAVGHFAVKELGEKWKIKRQESKEDKGKTKGFVIDLSAKEQVDKYGKVALEDALQRISAQQIRSAIEAIEEHQKLILGYKKKIRIIERHVINGDTDTVNADMRTASIKDKIAEHAYEIEREMQMLGWVVEKQ